MKTLTASDRSALIRLAASLPVGDENRRAILAGLSKSASFFPSYTEADYVDAAYRIAEQYPNDFPKVFAVLAMALKVPPSGAFDPEDFGDLLTTYNFHRERESIEPLLQAGQPIPYRQIVGRSPFMATKGLPKDQIAGERWRYDNANQTFPVPQVKKAIAGYVGMRPGQMFLRNDLMKYLMEYVNMSLRSLQRLDLQGPVVTHRDLVG